MVYVVDIVVVDLDIAVVGVLAGFQKTPSRVVHRGIVDTNTITVEINAVHLCLVNFRAASRMDVDIVDAKIANFAIATGLRAKGVTGTMARGRGIAGI